MSEFEGGDERLAWQLQPAVVHDDHVTAYLERQLTDTVLPSAGISIGYREYYYGIHTGFIDRQRIIGSLTACLTVAAEGLYQFAQTWDPDKGDPPRQIVGVTHLGLARLAQYAGFSCVELPYKVFHRKINSSCRWGDLASAVLATYEYDTESGKRGKPFRVGVIAQPVDQFVDRWRQPQFSRNDVPL